MKEAIQAVKDFFCLGKKFLVFNMVTRNIKIKYRRSVLGLFWTMIGPVSQTLVFFLVFRVVLKVQVEHYLVMLLSGMLPWTFFSMTVMEGMESIVSNAGLVTKVPMPVQVFPLVGMITNLVTLGLAMPVLLAVAVFSSVPLSPAFLALIPLFAILALLAYSMSFLVAVAMVVFRDLRHIMTFVMQLMFYATPVIYEAGMVPPQYRWLAHINPVAPLFDGIHTVMVRSEWPTVSQWGTPLLWAVGLGAVAVVTARTSCDALVEQL